MQIIRYAYFIFFKSWIDKERKKTRQTRIQQKTKLNTELHEPYQTLACSQVFQKVRQSLFHIFQLLCCANSTIKVISRKITSLQWGGDDCSYDIMHLPAEHAFPLCVFFKRGLTVLSIRLVLQYNVLGVELVNDFHMWHGRKNKWYSH